jgi:hypothetical protein
MTMQPIPATRTAIADGGNSQLLLRTLSRWRPPAALAVVSLAAARAVLRRLRSGPVSRRMPRCAAGARRHLYILGETGAGQGTLLSGVVLAGARAGRGVLVIDPEGHLSLPPIP